MSRRCEFLRVLMVVVAAVAVMATASLWPENAEAGKKKELLAQLPPEWRAWLEQEVYPLISSEQKRAFLELESEAQRRAFADRLWVLWGRQTGYGPSFRRVYGERLAYCRTEFENTYDDRSRVTLIHGPAPGRFAPNCTNVFYGLEIWHWPYLEGLGEDVVVLFYQPYGLGKWRMWNAYEGRQVLYTYSGWEAKRTARSRFDQPEYTCFDGGSLMRMIAAAEYWMRDPKTMAAMAHLPRDERPGQESSSSRFMEFSALVDDDAEPLDFAVTEQPRGMRGGKVKMGFSVHVPAESLGHSEVGDVDVVQLDVVGEISRQTEMVDRFRYLFTVPAAGDELSLLMERYVRPGDYELRLKVEDAHSRRAEVSEFEFTARPPTIEEMAVLDPTAVLPPEGGPARGRVEIDGGTEEQPVLLLLGPEGEAVSGLQRFEAVVQRQVARVAFLVNDEEVMVKNRPPFDVDIDLGSLPRLTTVTAVAFGAPGAEIDRQEISLNVGRERFYLRIRPITPADAEEGRVRVQVDVNTPSDAALNRLEMYWNDRLLATLFQGPFEAWVNPSTSGEFGYLRAVAFLEDGGVAEDILFVNAPRFGPIVGVTAVELPVTVYNRSGKPVDDLQPEDFTVLEDGVAQEISYVALHRDLPIRMGIVIDTSGSMERSLPDVQRVVMGFLKNLLRPRDRAYIETFSDQPDLLASFTADFDTLENALLALYADRSTAFFDGVITGLFQFSGLRGRRSMVVLTDGEDTASTHTFDEALEYAQRAGVTIYTIGIDLPVSKIVVRHHLKRLADVTGGKAFFLPRHANLEDVYATIDRELRTQYLVAYTSSSERPPEELREIKVKVARKGARVRTIAGYYPVRF